MTYGLKHLSLDYVHSMFSQPYNSSIEQFGFSTLAADLIVEKTITFKHSFNVLLRVDIAMDNKW